ncbi:MAG: hypothetical protein LUQ56_09595 [Methylococcaceae bacterium]|nr:hypothetical protein [Methylococcaceae bacterium]
MVEDAICSHKTEHKFYALQRTQQQCITIQLRIRFIRMAERCQTS